MALKHQIQLANQNLKQWKQRIAELAELDGSVLKSSNGEKEVTKDELLEIWKKEEEKAQKFLDYLISLHPLANGGGHQCSNRKAPKNGIFKCEGCGKRAFVDDVKPLTEEEVTSLEQSLQEQTS